MANVVINLQPNPYYRGIKSLDGYQYEFSIHWNTTTEKWYLDLKSLDPDIDTDIKSIALLPGRDLLEPFGEYQLGSLYVYDNSTASDDPNFDDIGSRFTLEYVPLDDS